MILSLVSYLAAALVPVPAELPALACRSGGSPALQVAASDQDPKQDKKKEYEKRLKEAGDDVDALWSVHEWCDSNGMRSEARKVARKILKLDEFHPKAHEALGHVRYDGKWFNSEKELEKYKQAEEERIAKEQGLVRWEDQWVDPGDVPFLERGLVRAPDGSWVSPEDLEKMQQGWLRQDLVWVPPAEASKIEAGLWKCGDEWLSLEEANRYHSRPSRWWVIPSDHYVLHTSCDRAVAEQAIDQIEYAFRDLVRLYGVVPKVRLNVALFRSLDQYNQFASEDDLGTSGLYGAYFPVNWIDWEKRVFHAGGMGYWDASSDAGNLWGPLFVRHAAGLSFSQAVDPSPKTLSKFAKSRTGAPLDVESFLKEKSLPSWLTFGAATYVSRYWTDLRPGQDPDGMRKWSVSMISQAGGLSSLETIFDSAPVVRDEASAERSRKWLNEAGLVVAFILDGDVPEVKQAHQALKAALKAGKGTEREIRELEKTVQKQEDELKAFAGL